MKIIKRMSLLLLLVAFIGLMGFNEPAFAAGKPTVPPAWYQKLSANKRFQLVLDGEAVLDRETGLVWERSPDTTLRNWYQAIFHCYNMNLGGRKGWRLPTVEELASLIDPTQSNPALPAGHPFQNVQSFWYWSATTLAFAGYTGDAWGVYFNVGSVDNDAKSINGYVWCVRGGQGYDGQ
ncbi:MAG: DUF1566 domain-containing protein [Deltaproteobacteria bacterium]|nr:DUF1566 domain-containing protein [Deltaproteobacteria bacterium]